MTDLKNNLTKDTDDSSDSSSSGDEENDKKNKLEASSGSSDSDDDSEHDDNDDDDGTKSAASASSSSSSSSHNGTVKVDNPFHTLDFNELKERRERARKARLSEMKSSFEAALKSLDEKERTNLTDEDAASVVTSNSTPVPALRKNKPNLVVARAKTKLKSLAAIARASADDNPNKPRNFNWFSAANSARSNDTDQKVAEEDIVYEEAVIDFDSINVGKRSIAIWPYDEYHMIQQDYWDTVKNLGKDYETYDPYLLCKLIQQNSDKKIRHYTEEEFEKLHEKLVEQSREKNRPIFFGQSSALTIPIFSRPQDPPDLGQQVRTLGLSSFEEKAVERAISVVSTWLFDVGLIDELLRNGGTVGRTTAAAQAAVKEVKRNSNSLENIDVTSKHHGNRRKNRNRNKGKGKHNFLMDDDSVGSNDTDCVLEQINKSQAAEDADDLLPTEEADISKMDREIAKLRNSTKRSLALVNARLKDSVKAIGSEVQELVNAVVGTKDDIGRLRDLSSYIHNAGEDEQTSQQFMLTKYPKLKQAINARRNLVRVFRELDFFSQIPITCDRLREEMHDGEWTADEFSSLRSVAREHVDLEIFLIEAEAGMKRRMEEEEAEILASKNRAGGAGAGDRSRGPKGGRQGFGNAAPMSGNYALIDRFLEEHVKNVWEMGEEISIRIMNGISNAFELSLTNPAGMVALVEAVEVYESANEDYRVVHGEEAGKRNTKLQFTGMRAQALAELYRDFEVRCTDVFTELSMQRQTGESKGGTETPDDEEASNKQFSAILRAANELGSEITIVNEKMAPCFPENWAITTLWTTCVAHICSNNILQQIGGADGPNLPDLSLKQLLDLVAWVETFRQTISEIFPSLSKITASKRSYLDKAPKLLVENSKMIDVALAEDSLVWVNNTLWNIHNMAKDEFLFKTKEMAEVWLERGYSAEREVMKGSDGKYRTAFSEDIYAMTSIHLRTIRERLTRRSEALVQAVGVVFKILYDKQSKARDSFCNDFQTCCAAANDFLRMSEKCEEIVDEIKQECNLSSKASEILEEQSAALLGIYSGDAVFAAKKTQTYCLTVIEEEITEELFSPEWEEVLTENETAHAIVNILDECMGDVETGVDELLVSRAAEAQVSLVVNFYISTLLKKGASVKGSKHGLFKDSNEAIERMRDDVEIFRKYFRELGEEHPTLGRLADDEFSLLESVIALLEWGGAFKKSEGNDGGGDQLKLKECIAPLQKRLKNVAVVKFFVGELLTMINPSEEKNLYEILRSIQEWLTSLVSEKAQTSSAVSDRSAILALRLDQILTSHMENRKEGLKSITVSKAMNALRSFSIMKSTATKKEEVVESNDDTSEKDSENQ